MSERFDNAAKSWDEKPGRLEMASKFAEVIKMHLDTKKHHTALEFGCGTANVSFFLKDTFSKIILADASVGMLDEVKKKVDSAGTNHLFPVFMDLEKETSDEKVDMIYTLMALHHVTEVETVLEKLANMLNPGGLLVIGDLEKEDGNFHAYPENQDVHFGFEQEYLENVLVDKNLSIIKYTRFHELIREHTGVPKLYPLFALVVGKDNFKPGI